MPKPAGVYRQILSRHGRHLPVAEVEAILTEARRRQDAQVPGWVADDLTLDPHLSAQRREIHVDTVVTLAGVADRVGARAAFYALYVNTELFTLFPDVPATLSWLRARGYRMGIVSNWESRLRALCAAHGIDDYFDFAVISEVEGFAKPHPRLYERALELAGVPPAQVVHVGDKLREDVEGATAAGITAVLLDRGENGTAAYAPRIRSLAELPGLLAPEVEGTRS